MRGCIKKKDQLQADLTARRWPQPLGEWYRPFAGSGWRVMSSLGGRDRRWAWTCAQHLFTLAVNVKLSGILPSLERGNTAAERC